MGFPPLKQQGLIDIATWEQDAEFGVFPQGARDKNAVFSPAIPPESVIVPGKRYLFKRSKKSYPDQYWGEIVAYRIGCLLGVEVPPAFAAWNSVTGYSAALIEWFYQDGEEACVLAGDFLQKIDQEFDRGKGERHNLQTITVLLRAFCQAKFFRTAYWQQWWADALLFDSLIGNTDRHQDNWGLLFRFGKTQGRLTPLFDNGTGLGHERFPDRTSAWTGANFSRYVERGKHHVSWSLEDTRIRGHFELFRRVIDEWPETKSVLCDRIQNVTTESILDVLSDLLHLPAPVVLSEQRLAFMMRLLDLRLSLLKEILL